MTSELERQVMWLEAENDRLDQELKKLAEKIEELEGAVEGLRGLVSASAVMSLGAVVGRFLPELQGESKEDDDGDCPSP